MSEHPTELPRREFLQLLGLGAAAALSPKLVFGNDQTPEPIWNHLVPADKQLDPAWLKSLTERGEPTVYSKPDLKFIGMPVGGFFAGQLYLGGDGKLWLWDIFNGLHNTAGEHYAHPQEAFSPIDQGFALRVNGKDFPLDVKGFSEVTFRGEYPIGIVTYKDPACPVTVTMEAFSPFCPLDADASSLPATVMRFTLNNTSDKSVDTKFGGWLENKICSDTNAMRGDGPANFVVDHDKSAVSVKMTVRHASQLPDVDNGPTIVFADFEGDTFAPWRVEGEAFGSGPTSGAPDPEQHLSGFSGKRLANSWAKKSDAPRGKLVSPAFSIDRTYVNFLIGGGNHPDETCINLMIDGQVALTATGKNSDQMQWNSWRVDWWKGKQATIEIVDANSGGWGHIEIDQIEFSDQPRVPLGKMTEQPGYGTLCFALMQPENAHAQEYLHPRPSEHLFDAESGLIGAEANVNYPTAGITCEQTLKPGESRSITFAITWHFPNLTFAVTRWDPNHTIAPGDVIEKGRYYSTKFDSAETVADYLAKNHESLYQQTKLWRDTWYDSTLAYWFLDRTIANISTLATSTSYRFANGRYWGWEGVGSCRGTCTHVYGYEQSVGRLFPELDRLLRERNDFGAGFNLKTGAIGMRGEQSGPAIDGTCMIILRTLRDHQTSADDSFLKTNWPKIKLAIEWLIGQDKNADGILTGPQANTLDAEWFGAVPWISGLYLAALRAAEEMASAMTDTDFARQCQTLRETGQKNFAPKMFNGEYFVQIPDAKHLKAVGSFDGCEIDQVLGQSWAWQVGLGRVLPEKETKSALAALWKYNFAKDVGPFRAKYKPGRWFAMPGETGTIMCSWPRGEKNRVTSGFDYYFNECMNGFEHQLAGHMIWEGMVTEGLAIERAVHDRYHAGKRNPWNEIECGDHYARSMASFGVFLAACGFEYHGPRGELSFAPKITPENFKAPFITAEGWGTYSQKLEGKSMKVELTIKHGQLKLNALTVMFPEKMQPTTAAATLAGKPLGFQSGFANDRVRLERSILIEKDQMLQITLA